MQKFNYEKTLLTGKYFNTGIGSTIQAVDIGHKDYLCLIEPDVAFWALVRKDKLKKVFTSNSFLKKYLAKKDEFYSQMNNLRFGLKLSAVYFNPTDRCNLNCQYCYIPESLRKNGKSMSYSQIIKALAILKEYFYKVLPKGVKPQVIFHGAEPLLCKDSIFKAITTYKNEFYFGIQTNGSIINKEDIKFLTTSNVNIGLSLDGHISGIADRTRKTWKGNGVFKKVVKVLEDLNNLEVKDYNVICTVTTKNMHSLVKIVEFFHRLNVPVCMLNPIRCTQENARALKPKDKEIAIYYLKALDKTFELYEKTGHKLIVANFANIILSIIAPPARRLMCDISPCGGGRCFFAISANGDIFPCSEFIGLKEFKGGNLFKDKIEKVFLNNVFTKVCSRKVEEINPCFKCAIRHFCGAPCPAEAYAMNESLNKRGAFCELYEEQVRYAFRQIANGKENAYLWDNWDKETFNII